MFYRKPMNSRFDCFLQKLQLNLMIFSNQVSAKNEFNDFKTSISLVNQILLKRSLPGDFLCRSSNLELLSNILGNSPENIWLINTS